MPQAARIPPRSLTEDVLGVEAFRWQPHRFRPLPAYQPQNFGDELAAAVVRAIASRLQVAQRPSRARGRLLSIGSVMHFAQDFDTVWGAGVNGKVSDPVVAELLDVRAVRGPITRDLLLARGILAPPVFGDPGLLVPELFPETRQWSSCKQHALAVVPNFNDAAAVADHPAFVNPLAPLWQVIRRIAQSEFVVASSLHGIVIAEALGVPVRPLRSAAEAALKYDDYALGTGRSPFEFAESVAEAERQGPIAPLEFSTAALLEAFPADLWRDPAHTEVVFSSGDLRDPGVTSALRDRREHDEVIVTVPAEHVAALSEAEPLGDVIVVGTPAATFGARLQRAVQWSRGTTLSVLSAGDQRPEGALHALLDAHETSGASLTFGRPLLTGDGPDEYPWSDHAGVPDRIDGLAARPDLLAARHPANIIFSRAHLDATRWHFDDSNADPTLEPMAWELRRPTPIALDGRVFVHRHRPSPEPDPVDTALMTRVRALRACLHDADRATIAAAVIAGLPELWHAPSGSACDAPGPHANPLAADSRTAEACESLRQELMTAGLQDDAAVDLLALASLGAVDAAAHGFSDSHPPLGPFRFAAVAHALNRSSRPCRRPAARALLRQAVSAADGAAAAELALLRTALLDLDYPLGGPRHEHDVPEHLRALVTDAAAGRDDLVALGLSRPGSVIISHAAATPLGWIVSGSAPALLSGRRFLVRVRDASADVQARIGSIRIATGGDGDASFTGVIRSAGAPAGMLELTARDGSGSLPLGTSRASAPGIAHQLLHPVTLPLDGGQALLVRRPSPQSALRARLKQ